MDLKKELEADFELSANDLLFAIAFDVFYETDCDFAVIEIPIGNLSHIVFGKPLISVITSTRDALAARSVCARIDRDSGEVVTAIQNRDVYDVIFNKCAEINCRLSMPLKKAFHIMSSSVKRTDFTYHGIAYSVAGGAYYQIENLLTVFEATEALRRNGIKIPGTDICSSVLGEEMPLRFEPISVMPTIIVDRADTDSRRMALLNALKKLEIFISKKPIVICEQEKQVIQEDFAAFGLDVTAEEISMQGARKLLRSILKGLGESDTVIVLGSSAYCEHLAKTIREILM